MTYSFVTYLILFSFHKSYYLLAFGFNNLFITALLILLLIANFELSIF